MAEKSNKTGKLTLDGGDSTKTSIGGTQVGNSPEVAEGTLTADNRVISSVAQAIGVTTQDINDARKLIRAAQRITAKKQGAPPYDPKKLKDQGKSGSKRNVSTRFLQKELNRAAPRFYMPVLSASTLTAAELPAGWPKGQEKTQFFRDTMTRAIRSWRKNDMLWRGAGAEVCDYGYGFMCWPDPKDWKPLLVRMDRGFVPKGSEIMDDGLARFTLKWDYRPSELLRIAREAIEAGSEGWNKEAVAMAVQQANQPSKPGDMSQLRKWEELVREQVVDYSTSKAERVIETRHLWVLEFTGKISHYILWPDGTDKGKLLFEQLDERDSMDQVVIPLVFGYGDGTIQGSWGPGQLLYDLAAQVEKIRCDSMDNLLNSNKARLQVANAKDVAAAQLVINDTMIIACGATFAQNIGGISGDPKGYMALDGEMTKWAQEIVGSYLPPIPSQASKAATAVVEQAQEREQAIQQDNLENWLKQVAIVIAEIIRRMTAKDSDDEYSQAVRAKLLGDNVKWYEKMVNRVWEAAANLKPLKDIIPPAPVRLTEEELAILVHQPAVQSVADYTQFAASQRAAFAASVKDDPGFNPTACRRYMAAGVPNAGAAFASDIVASQEDLSTITAQQRQQLQENASMLLGIEIPVVVTDAHQIHLDTMKEPMNQAIQGGLIQQATTGLKHAASHFAAGSATKTLAPATINTWKAQLATWQKAIEAKTLEQQQAQAQQQAQQGGIPPGGGQVPPAPMVQR